jgi:hypothetical protein
MSEMVERVARAFYSSFYDDESWPPVPFDSELRDADSYREAARAAIQAMREPTEAMTNIGWVSMNEERLPWEAMIDAALKP